MAFLLFVIALGLGLVLASIIYAAFVVIALGMAATLVALLLAAGCAKLFQLFG